MPSSIFDVEVEGVLHARQERDVGELKVPKNAIMYGKTM